MESEEKEDQEEVGMKEQRSQRRVHICKFNNGQVGMDGVLAPEDGVSRKADMICIYCTVLAVLVGVYSQRHPIISQLFYYRLQRRYYNHYSTLSTERSVDVLSPSRLTSNSPPRRLADH
jgi:hypothetical protein